MTKITLRKVVAAVEKVRGPRGARFKDILEEVLFPTHYQEVDKSLRKLVQRGKLEQRGQKFRLVKHVTQQTHQGSAKRCSASRGVCRGTQCKTQAKARSLKRRHSSFEQLKDVESCSNLCGRGSSSSTMLIQRCSTDSQASDQLTEERALSGSTRRCSTMKRRRSSFEHLRDVESCYTLCGQTSSSSTILVQQSSSDLQASAQLTEENEQREASEGSSDSSVSLTSVSLNHLLLGVRDSVEILREKMSTRTNEATTSQTEASQQNNLLEPSTQYNFLAETVSDSTVTNESETSQASHEAHEPSIEAANGSQSPVTNRKFFFGLF